jgi:hypothetical protein
MITQNSTSNVVNNVTSESNTSSGGSTSHTSITTTTNGVTTHVESNDSGSVHVQTVNGETTVQTSPGMKVNVTKGEANVEDNLSPTPTQSPHSSESAKENEESVKKMIHEEKKNILEEIKFAFENFFKNFHF